MTTAELLSQIRHLYKEVGDLPAKTADFKELIAQMPDELSTLRLAYEATTVALKARETWLPWEKLAYFQQAMTLFGKALAYQSEEIEVRFLRYTIQKNTPFFLGLSTHVQEDKQQIIKHIAASPTDLYMKQSIARYLLQHEYFTAKEKEVLSHILTTTL
jgi:hypothetical protein